MAPLPLHAPDPPPSTSGAARTGAGWHHTWAGRKKQDYATSNHFSSHFFLFQTQLIPVSMHKNTFQSHTVGSCEMYPGSPICASRLVIHWQVPDPAEDDPCDSEDHALCGKIPPKITKETQKDVRHSWFCGGTDLLSWELHYNGKPLFSHLVALAHFKASTTVPRHWNCGCVAKPPEHSPFPMLLAMQGINRSEAFLLAQAKPHVHHNTKQSYHFHEFHSSKSTKSMQTGSCDPSKHFLKKPKT